jgi:hypothetical protein
VFERFFKLASCAALVLALSLGSAGAAETTPNDFVYELQRIDLQAILPWRAKRNECARGILA